MRAARISQKMHRRQATSIMVLIALFYLLIGSGAADELPGQGEQGICLPPPALWPLPRWIDVIGGLTLNGIMLLLMSLINKAYNVLRSPTRLQIGLFAIMAASVPRLVVNINSGILLAVSVFLCIFFLFSCYDNPYVSRRIFLAFLLLSIGSMMQYSFVVYIPVMWIVVAQMRIFSLRTFLASVFGIVTPWIIFLGFGIVTPDELHFPVVTSVFSSLEMESAFYLLAVTAFTAFLLVGATGLNLTKTIAYNAQARAYNGAFNVIAVVTIIAMAVNYNNLLAYLPMLNVCAAYQITHWFVNHRFERQYIAVLSVCAVYITFYIWRMII